jgi:hypothetical protein
MSYFRLNVNRFFLRDLYNLSVFYNFRVLINYWKIQINTLMSVFIAGFIQLLSCEISC